MILNNTQSKFFNSPNEMGDLFSNGLQDDMSPLGDFSDFEGYEVWGFWDQNQPKATRETFERKLNLNSLYKKVHGQKPRDQSTQDRLNTTDFFQYRVEPLLEGNEHVITERRIHGKTAPMDSGKNKMPDQATQRPAFRRKSDVSSWSGGTVRLEAKTSFMTFSVRLLENTGFAQNSDSLRSPKYEKKKFMTALDITKKTSKPSQSRGYTTLVKLKSSNHLDRLVPNGVSITLPPENLAPSLTDNGQTSQRAKITGDQRAFATSIIAEDNLEATEPKGNEHKTRLSLFKENESNLKAVTEEVVEKNNNVSNQKSTQKPKVQIPEKPKIALNNIRPLSQQWKQREFRISKNANNPVEFRENARPNTKLENKKSLKLLPQIFDQKEQTKSFKQLRIVSNSSSLKASSISGAISDQRVSQRYNPVRSIANSTSRDFQPLSANCDDRRIKGSGKPELRHWSSQAKIILHSQPNESISTSSLTNSGCFYRTESKEAKDQPSPVSKLRNVVIGVQGLTRLKNAAAEKKIDTTSTSKRSKLAKIKVHQMKTIYARVLQK